jgi:ATP-binding cassette subfamily F protein uup
MSEALISGNGLSLTLGGRSLFRNLSFSFLEGEKVGLIGANGVGKSTLCKLILGQIAQDSGTISKRKNLKIGYLSQTPEVPLDKTIFQTLVESSPDEYDWKYQSMASELFSRFEFEKAGLNESSPNSILSGGWRKKLALASQLMSEPDLLILDEPTNHLDVESILWLEDYLFQSSLNYIAITHDRAFLDNISNVIWELDPRNVASNGILKVNGNYADYCEVKDSLMSALEAQQSKLHNTLRRETEWLRRGPKARTTKQNARIERAYSLQDEVSNLDNLNQKRKVEISFQSIDGTPKKLVDLKNVGIEFNNRALFSNFDFTLERGQKMGLIGANGSGKSTLIKLITGENQPTSGTIYKADNLKISYFDQNRAALNPKVSVLKTICPEGDYVQYQGRYIHARGYLEKFLFSTDDIDKPISKLSGGEQARLLIAQLMLRECNLLILDEPTNDLDIQTLNILENELRDYPGALIIVSHDRYFMDQVAQFHFSISNGKVTRFASVHQWEESTIKEKASIANKGTTPASKVTVPIKQPTRKLSNKEKYELDNIENEIGIQESELEKLQKIISSPATDPIELKKKYEELSKIQVSVDKLYARWDELLKIKNGEN